MIMMMIITIKILNKTSYFLPKFVGDSSWEGSHLVNWDSLTRFVICLWYANGMFCVKQLKNCSFSERHFLRICSGVKRWPCNAMTSPISVHRLTLGEKESRSCRFWHSSRNNFTAESLQRDCISAMKRQPGFVFITDCDLNPVWNKQFYNDRVITPQKHSG